jgi:uncharacterized protein YdhG (YjbR/CyaY superfamily)
MKLIYYNTDEYIALQNDIAKTALQNMRAIIKKEIPHAAEVISYGMPAFKQHNKVLVYFAACKNHLGFYPTGSGIAAFEHELGNYKYSKGCIQFKYGNPLPTKLIQKIVQFRLSYTNK